MEVNKVGHSNNTLSKNVKLDREKNSIKDKVELKAENQNREMLDADRLKEFAGKAEKVEFEAENQNTEILDADRVKESALSSEASRYSLDKDLMKTLKSHGIKEPIMSSEGLKTENLRKKSWEENRSFESGMHVIIFKKSGDNGCFQKVTFAPDESVKLSTGAGDLHQTITLERVGGYWGKRNRITDSISIIKKRGLSFAEKAEVNKDLLNKLNSHGIDKPIMSLEGLTDENLRKEGWEENRSFERGMHVIIFKKSGDNGCFQKVTFAPDESVKLSTGAGDLHQTITLERVGGYWGKREQITNSVSIEKDR